MTELQRDTLAYGVVAAASAYLLIWIIPAYTPEYPGYGVPASLLPDIAAGFMLALSLLGLGRAALSWRKAEKSGGDGQTAVRWRHLACFLIPCALLMPAMSLFGFLPAGIAFMVVIQIGCGQRRWLPMTLVSVAPVLLGYAIMRFGLGVPMP
ncbi:tripartite tricarboxylate transporter TctB family protein [Bilophila wadsworthia]|uniref:tripartite tricarboxylate transporter TctB family protein n=1 Tax=Bilophila wadsworthia TaxID=35833 RepID=UPI003A87289E